MNTPSTPNLDRRAQLQTQLDAIHTELESMDNAVQLETLLKGIALTGAQGCFINVKYCHEGCIDGIVDHTDPLIDGYDIQKHFGFDGYHDHLSIEVQGLGRVVASADDGVFKLGVYFTYTEDEKKDEQLAFEYTKLPATKVFFAKYGVKLRTTTLEYERNKHLADAQQLARMMKLIEG